MNPPINQADFTPVEESCYRYWLTEIKPLMVEAGIPEPNFDRWYNQFDANLRQEICELQHDFMEVNNV